MHSFKITNQFLLDDEPFTILSGAIHYMRVHPSDWHHSLYNLKALGFNTVETYVPWNLHEPKPGVFDFSGSIDLAAFLDEARSVCNCSALSVYLCRMGIWRHASMAAART